MWVLVHLPGCDLQPSFSLRVTYLFSASIFIFVLGVYIQEGNRIPSTKPTSREQPQPRGTQGKRTAKEHREQIQDILNGDQDVVSRGCEVACADLFFCVL